MSEAVSEIDLIHRYIRHDDRSAISRLFEPYEQALYRYLWQMLKHQQDSEDALQETIRKALRALPNYREDGHFKSWLFRIARNTALDQIRRRQKVTALEEPDSEVAEQSSFRPEPDSALIAKERCEQLENAIAELSEAEREVVLLRFQADLSFKEIADMLGTPIGTILARMHRAKSHLKLSLTPTT